MNGPRGHLEGGWCGEGFLGKRQGLREKPQSQCELRAQVPLRTRTGQGRPAAEGPGLWGEVLFGAGQGRSHAPQEHTDVLAGRERGAGQEGEGLAGRARPGLASLPKELGCSQEAAVCRQGGGRMRPDPWPPALPGPGLAPLWTLWPTSGLCRGHPGRSRQRQWDVTSARLHTEVPSVASP